MKMKGCKTCKWHVRTHYKGTPKSEVYNECEYHNKVLHSDDIRCADFTTKEMEI